MTVELINLWYIVSAALFIYGLKQLGSPATAVRGNLMSSIGMFIAVAATLLSRDILEFQWIAAAVAVGAIIGALAAQRVAMTGMPEMVALFNGSGGLASLLVGWAALYGSAPAATAQVAVANVTDAVTISTFTVITILLSILIGGITFSGSLIAWGKLAEVMTSRAIVFGAQRFVNALILLALIACGVMFALEPSLTSPYLYAVIGLSLVFGVMAVIPI
ncbi:MAG: NAD(P)(+) transhydrogenase (Re/Si-specific) subunit beta, partial [Gammaproteobacteria bacterium]|nr:NAD(P)(+) transhydrogenase (Re/Si-specific) subunit beta [Gammaproteobacteria bacterium]